MNKRGLLFMPKTNLYRILFFHRTYIHVKIDSQLLIEFTNFAKRLSNSTVILPMFNVAKMASIFHILRSCIMKRSINGH